MLEPALGAAEAIDGPVQLHDKMISEPHHAQDEEMAEPKIETVDEYKRAFTLGGAEGPAGVSVELLEPSPLAAADEAAEPSLRSIRVVPVEQDGLEAEPLL